MASEYTINADGTITRNGTTSSYSSGYNNGGSSGGNGWIWILVIVGIIVGIIIAVNSDDNDNNSYSEPTQRVYETEVSASDETSNSATYLRVSNSDVTFDSEGGSVDIDIYTDGDWHIGTSTASWGHISKYSSSITLRVDGYYGDDDRTDWFTIVAGDYERRIEITQHADTKPSADIGSVWVDHNEYYNGYKGMMIHVGFTTENLLDKTVYVYAYFYYEDNVTPLHNQYGNDLYYYGTGKVNYKSCRFDDFKIFVPYVGLFMAPGWSGSLSFDIVVKHGGDLLDRDNNNQFTYTRGY